jgi:CheY-like chemotaxis protein
MINAAIRDTRILVVDSDRVGRRLAALLLERLGCPPPVLIDDATSLPDGDWSLVLFGECIAVPPLRDALGARTRLVAMITQDDDARRRACLQAGADEILVKPLALQDLAELLARSAPRSGDFNIAAWNELCELFDAAGVAQLVGALINDLPMQRTCVADAIRDADFATLRHIAHTLRGVSLQLGSTALAGQWTVVERTAGAGEVEPVLRLSGELIERHAALVECLRHEIRRR